MAEKMMKKEQVDYIIDILVTMVVEELSEDLNKEPEAVLADFIESGTGTMLYDETSKLWWNGPSYIADMYREEIWQN